MSKSLYNEIEFETLASDGTLTEMKFNSAGDLVDAYWNHPETLPADDEEVLNARVGGCGVDEFETFKDLLIGLGVI